MQTIQRVDVTVESFVGTNRVLLHCSHNFAQRSPVSFERLCGAAMMKLEEAKQYLIARYPCLQTEEGRICNQPKIDEHFGEFICDLWGSTLLCIVGE